jgi:hypothetical protein
MDLKDFGIDTRIALNRQRVREQFEQYKRVESYYGFFFAYMALLGYGIFDVLAFGFQNGWVLSCLQLFTLILIFIVFSTFFFFAKLIWLKGFHVDPIPKNIYSNFDANKGTLKKKALELEVKKSYLQTLEVAVEQNQKIYDNKKKYVDYLLKSMMFVFLLYVPLLTNVKMSDNDKDKDVKVEKPALPNIKINPTIQNESRTEKGSKAESLNEVLKEKAKQRNNKQ